VPEFSLWEHELRWLQWTVVVVATAVAAATDLRSRRIPNLLTFPLLIAGLVFAVFVGGLAGLGESALACLLLGFPFVVLFLFAGGGAGDAKLMAAVGAWVGLVGGTVTLLCVTAAGIVLAISYAVAKRRTQEVVANLAGMATGLILVAMRHGRVEQIPRVERTASMETIPYGLAIFAGTALSALGVLLWHA